MFDYWKYYHNWIKELEKLKYAVTPFNKFEKFITYFLNIKILHNKLSWLYFKSSFGVSDKTYTQEDIKPLISNWNNDEDILNIFSPK